MSWRALENAEPLPEVGITEGLVFEALFLRGLDTPPELRRALSGIGVDLDQLAPRYPSTLWIASIDLARSYLYPHASSSEAAERELGRKFMAGFFRTVTGRVLAAVLPFMTISSVAQRLPRYYRMGRNDFVMDVEEVGPREVRIHVADPATARPWFFAGMTEAGLERVGAPFRLEMMPRDTWRFEVSLSWSA